MGWPSRGSASRWRVGQEMSRPCGQRRALASRRGRQGRTVLPRIRREWTGPNDGAVRVANTHGCAVIDLGDALASGEPGADELAGVALVGGRAGGADGLAAVAARDGGLAVQGGEFAGGGVDHVGAGAELYRVGAGVLGGELVFPGPEVGAGDRGVVGGRPGSRARYGFGTQSGCRGSISRHSHHLSGSW